MGDMMHFFSTEKDALDACAKIPNIDGEVSYAGNPPHVEYVPKPYCVPIQGADGWYVISDLHTDKHVTVPKKEYKPLSE